jgi:hypothetical protein
MVSFLTVCLFSNAESIRSFGLKDSIDVDALKKKMTDIQSKSAELKPKAGELVNLFQGYKVKAKLRKCNKASKEAEDGLDMAQKASKDCEAIDKLAEKLLKAKKPEEVKKLTTEADHKIKNAKFFIQQAEDRKKEAEFELRGCD